MKKIIIIIFYSIQICLILLFVNFNYSFCKEKKIKLKIDTSRVYESFKVDVQPAFPGGSDSLTNFILNNLPIEQAYFSYSGPVCFCFLININGKAENLYLPSVSQNSMFFKSFNTLLKKMPKWKPGKIGKTNVKTYVCFPFFFKLR